MEGLVVVLVRRLNNHHAVYSLLLGLRHGCLGRLTLEARNHTLQTFYLLLLGDVILHLLVVVFLFAGDKIGIIARIAPCCAVLYLVYHIYHIVEKHTVMGYDNHCLRVRLQIALKPLNRRDIEVVGRLVQKQYVWL